MKVMNMDTRSPGITFNMDGEAVVWLWAPLPETVSISLPGKQTSFPMAPEQFGYWKAVTSEIKPGDKYQFLLDGKLERPDPASLSQPEGVHAPSLAVNIKAFPWSDNRWINPALEDYIFYELHTGTFTPEGDFAGIEKKLDHLKALGVTAIEIMPVAQFPGSRNWGYDGVFPFAVQESYGGARGLQHLVDACHRKGLAVVLDVIYNHLGPEGNYLGDFGPYFTDKYKTPWGNAINFDDAWCDGVRDYFIENALMWFRDFHIDALRLDAVHAIRDFSPVHILREIKLCTEELMKQTGRKHYLIVEADLNDNRFINPLEEQGYGMDAQWIDEFHHALRVTAGEQRNGYYSDFEGITHLAKSFKDAYVYDGQYSRYRKKRFGIKAEKNPGRQFIAFSQNHDQVGNRMLGERSCRLVSFEMQKLMAGPVMVSPYLPLLFMGEEWSEPNPFLYFVSHTDQELAEAVRQGRKEEFAAFHAQGGAPDPMDEQTFYSSKLQWDLLEREPHSTMLRYYRTLIALRKSLPALKELNRDQVDVSVSEEQQTLLLRRRHASGDVICLMNFSKQKREVMMPHGEQRWTKLVDSAAPEWKGPGAAADSASGDIPVTMQPESLLLFSISHA